MSLLEEFARPCVLLEKTRVFGNEGGWDTTYTDGAEFDNYQYLDTSMEARRAEKEGVSNAYSCIVQSSVPIEYGDYYRDTETGFTYRVTSDPVEKVTPASATLALKYFTAEKRALPT